jgi:hypothetical protein
MMQNKTTKEALLSIINRLKNSKILFKSFYETNKEKFDRIESNVDNFEKELEHLNNALNIYKWLLFISKTKEELFENMELLITKPDGSPIEFTNESKDIFFENSKPFQMFILLLELCRTKYENTDFESEENMKLFEKMRNEQADIDSHHILEELIKKEQNQESTESIDIQEGGEMNLNLKHKLSYINNEEAYSEYVKNVKNVNQIGGSSNDADFNRYRFAKLCYALDKPLPLKIPTVEFLNFKFDTNDDRFCIDIEFPWWPTMENMIPELFNKANIKQCMKEKCVQPFTDDKVKDSPEKQECVKSCIATAQPSLFDFAFFPLWSMKKYDPHGVIGSGVGFVRFFMNQLDSNMGGLDPLVDKLSGYIIEAIGAIPILGDIMNVLAHTFDDMADQFGDNLIPWFDAYLNILDKNFEEGFAIYSAAIPNATKMASSSESTVQFLDNMMPVFNKVLSGIDMATGVAANMNFTDILEMLKGVGKNTGPSDKTDEPSSEKTDEPSSEKTDEPSSEKTDEPSSEKTDEPSSDKTKEPSSDKTKEPSSKKTKEPSSKKTKEPKKSKKSKKPAKRKKKKK